MVPPVYIAAALPRRDRELTMAIPLHPAGTARSGLFLLLVLYAVTCAAHDGEFWPFSIYPMFSRAGHPWTRALVREVEQLPLSPWAARGIDALPGRPVALRDIGVFQNDLANYLAKTPRWNAESVGGLASMFAAVDLEESNLIVYQVVGRIASGSPRISAIPVLRLTADGALLNPDLRGGADAD